MLDLSQPHTLTDIVKSVSDKTVIGSALRTAEWSVIPAALRDQAFFSAGVTQAEFLARQRELITKVLARAKETNERGETYWGSDRAYFVAQCRQLGQALGVQHPAGDRDGKIVEGDITDPLSIARLKLIYDTQLELAYGKADWLTGMDADLLAAFPAWELVRISAREQPRDWPARWVEAAKAVGWEGVSKESFVEGRMIALKTSGVWVALSRFKKPHPPFDFNSGMGVEDIDRDEADSYELLGPGDELSSTVTAYDEQMQASVVGLGPKELTRLNEVTLGRVQVSGGVATWRADTPTPRSAALAVLTKPSKALKIDRAVNAEMAEALARVTARLDPLISPLKLNGPVPVNASWGDGHAHLHADGAPVGLEFGPPLGTPVLEAAHEVGHLWALTNLGAGSGTMAVDFTLTAEPWLRAALASAPVREMNNLLGTVKNAKARETLSYLLQPGEIWARCFSEWYAIRASDKQALHEVGRVLGGHVPHQNALMYWSNADFKPLLSLMDDLLS